MERFVAQPKPSLYGEVAISSTKPLTFSEQQIEKARLEEARALLAAVLDKDLLTHQPAEDVNPVTFRLTNRMIAEAFKA